jgi:FKBP-type peptidyl-prolyl cis-trans isomerase
MDDTKSNNNNSTNTKRKLSPENDFGVGDDSDVKIPQSPSSDFVRLTKKQRKKLAKQKEIELQSVIAKENKQLDEKEVTKKPIEKKASLTRKRTIEGGIIIQDIIHGTGPMVRSGRKVAINYTGTFHDSGKVFDKNTSKSSPLSFRVGTGEVIKGLDRGLAGMKVGGERLLTIPPDLAYGKKGNGNIPGNSTLCFSIKLLSVGAQ